MCFAYDVMDRLTMAKDPDSQYNYLEYDELGRLKSMSNAGTPRAPLVETTWKYDQTNAEGRSDERQIEVDYNLSSVQTTYVDELGRTKSVRYLGTSNARVDFTYTVLDQFDLIERYASTIKANPVVHTDYVYDSLNRLTTIDNGSIDYGYDYDRFNRVERFSTSDGETIYSYDRFHQLQDVDNPGQGNDEKYRYDANGNRNEEVGYQTKNPNLIESDGQYRYEYDKEGNRTLKVDLQTGEETTYLWDHRNRLARMEIRNGSVLTGELTVVYDVFDRRIERVADADGEGAGTAVTERFAYDGDHIALGFDGTNTLQHQYLFGPRVDQILADITAAGTLWALSDQLGSVRDLVNSQGQLQKHLQYGAFGQILADSNPALKFQFSYMCRAELWSHSSPN